GRHHRDEQLELAAVAERNFRVGMLRSEPLDDREDPRPFRADTAPRLVDVALRHLADGELGRQRRLRMLPQPRPGADDVENGTAGADELTRSRLEHALLDPGDRLRELRFEPG